MADYGHEYTNKQLKKLERELSKTYKQASEEISKKLEEKTAKFQEKIDKKKAELDVGKITKKEYKDWYKNQHEDIKRLTQLNDEIAEDLVNTNKIAAAIINGYTSTVYALNHNYGLYQIDNITGTTGSWTLYDKNTVEYLLQENPDLLPKKKVNVPKDKAWNKKHVNNSIMQGIIQGESVPKIAKRLADVVGMNQRSAVRNARTAMTGAQSAGRVSSYERARDMGIDLRQKWQATYDNRTRHSHRVVDGEIVDIDAVFSNGCRFPGDPEGPGYEVYNCRCTLVPVLKGFERKPLSGNNNFDYAEWEKQQTPPTDNNSAVNYWKNDPKTVENVQRGINKVSETFNIPINKAKKLLSNKLSKIIHKSDVGMAISKNNLISALKDKRLKNAFETGKSTLTPNLKFRREAENMTFGITDKNTKDADRPIYGALMPKLNKDSQDYYLNGPISKYGDGITILFNKNKIDATSTLSCGDSLNYSGRIGVSSLSNPSYAGIYNVSAAVNLAKDASLTELANNLDHYFEVQLHGKDSHSIDNISLVVIDKSKIKEDDDLIVLLKKHRIKIKWITLGGRS